MSFDGSLNFKATKYQEPLLKEKYYEAHVGGGRMRGGSMGLMMVCVTSMVSLPYFRGVFARKIKSQVKNSLWRGFKDLLKELSRQNGVDFESYFKIYDREMRAIYLPNGNEVSALGFKTSSKSQTANVRSIEGVTHVFIDELQEISYDEYKDLKLSVRKKDAEIKILSSFNPPPKEHWIIQNYYNLEASEYDGFYKTVPKKLKGFLSVQGTYLDNYQNLNENALDAIEQLKEISPKKYYRDILGLVSSGTDKKTFNNWQAIERETFYNLDYPSVYGMDVGDVSPTAIVEIKYNEGNFYIHEMLYKSNRTLKRENPEPIEGLFRDLFTKMGLDEDKHLIVDKAAKATIRELRDSGYKKTVGANKNPGSVKDGIDFMNKANIFYTSSSVNLEKEYNTNYLEIDRYGLPIDGKPIKGYDHLLDAARYGIMFMRVKHRIKL